MSAAHSCRLETGNGLVWGRGLRGSASAVPPNMPPLLSLLLFPLPPASVKSLTSITASPVITAACTQYDLAVPASDQFRFFAAQLRAPGDLSAAVDKAQLSSLLASADGQSARAHLQLRQRPGAGSWQHARLCEALGLHLEISFGSFSDSVCDCPLLLLLAFARFATASQIGITPVPAPAAATAANVTAVLEVLLQPKPPPQAQP